MASGTVVQVAASCLAAGPSLPETGSDSDTFVMLGIGAAAVAAGMGLRRFRRAPADI